MNKLIFPFALLFSLCLSAQQKNYFTITKDSTAFMLTREGASHFAVLPLKCLQQEYPNKTGHTSISDTDHVLTPQQLHPVFYGCFDWHSSVHGHWMLIKLLKIFPDLPEAEQIRASINKNITAENIKTEVAYFNNPIAKSWERTYGWAWLLKLQQELITWDDADGKKWSEALQPLSDTIIQLWQKFLPKQTYPNRTGTHGNTAFGLAFALDYAKVSGNKNFETAILKSANRLYGKDKNAPAIWEPDGADFFSPSLEEADLMSRVLPKVQFQQWFNNFFTSAGLKKVTLLPEVSDRNDYQIVHLDGLCFTRSWCIKNISKKLSITDPRRKQLLRAAVKHLNASLPHVASGGYSGEHWLASFAVYALSDF